jgi:hypothetical protein
VFGDCEISCETTQVIWNTGPNVPDIRNRGCSRTPQVSGYVNKTKDERNYDGNRERPKHSVAHTHLVRGGFVMLQPTIRAACRGVLDTHLVRGGLLKLQPTVRAAHPRFFAYPLRERWVPDAPAYSRAACHSLFCIPTS